MEEKEVLVRAHKFPKPPPFSARELWPIQGMAHTRITHELVQKSLFCQSPTKTLRPDKLNFKAIKLVWSWDLDRITAIVKNTIKLYHHSKSWKRAQSILLEKNNKRDKSLVKSYRAISLLNCMGKLLEKVVAEELSLFC